MRVVIAMVVSLIGFTLIKVHFGTSFWEGLAFLGVVFLTQAILNPEKHEGKAA